MKDFNIREAADETALNFPGIPQEVVRHICKSMMLSIVDTIKKKDARIRLQNGDIHTIYYDIVPDEQRALAADLDESRILTQEESDLSIIERANAKGNLPRKIKRLNRRDKRAHYERFSPDAIYPQ